MTQTPIPKLISQLAVPTIISMLVTSFYNMADTFFVGKINTSATAAVGVVFPLMTIIQAFGFFCGHGSGNYISRSFHGFHSANPLFFQTIYLYIPCPTIYQTMVYLPLG